ncbi:hypothetical protein ACW0US_17950 [Xanthomonas euvesicatoria]
MSKKPTALHLLSTAMKRRFLEELGYTLYPTDTEADFDRTLAYEVQTGSLDIEQLDAAIGT